MCWSPQDLLTIISTREIMPYSLNQQRVLLATYQLPHCLIWDAHPLSWQNIRIPLNTCNLSPLCPYFLYEVNNDNLISTTPITISYHRCVVILVASHLYTYLWWPWCYIPLVTKSWWLYLTNQLHNQPVGDDVVTYIPPCNTRNTSYSCTHRLMQKLPVAPVSTYTFTTSNLYDTSIS